jgi:hypothetical protein
MKSQKREDIWWGIRAGILAVCITLVPATIAFAVRWNENQSWGAARVTKMSMSFFAFGIVCGALAGNWRQQLATRKGSILFGTLVGAITSAALVTLFMATSEVALKRPLAAIVFGACLGAPAGGTVSWSWWASHRRHSRKG